MEIIDRVVTNTPTGAFKIRIHGFGRIAEVKAELDLDATLKEDNHANFERVVCQAIYAAFFHATTPTSRHASIEAGRNHAGDNGANLRSHGAGSENQPSGDGASEGRVRQGQGDQTSSITWVFTIQDRGTGYVLQQFITNKLPTWEEFCDRTQYQPDRDDFDAWLRCLHHLQTGQQPHASFVTKYGFSCRGFRNA